MTHELNRLPAQFVVSEWHKEAKASGSASESSGGSKITQVLPSHELFNAQRTIAAALGKLAELVSEVSVRILEVATQLQESRALYIAAERRVPDTLAPHDEQGGLSVTGLSETAKTKHRKLCPSYDVAKTAWQDAVSITKKRWERVEERVSEDKLI
ncbi:hypothetical protein N7451_004441 [Penicillium sp. IBT 35674x]|nr:hypothetical protein N7451_004441 [Penicillium sp. IBT 35674x]